MIACTLLNEASAKVVRILQTSCHEGMNNVPDALRVLLLCVSVSPWLTIAAETNHGDAETQRRRTMLTADSHRSGVARLTMCFDLHAARTHREIARQREHYLDEITVTHSLHARRGNVVRLVAGVD